MEDQGEQSLDGSSIKPVSSLRSHFEQMAKSTSNQAPAPPRPISPKPKFEDFSELSRFGTDDLSKQSIGSNSAGMSSHPPSFKVLPSARPLSAAHLVSQSYPAVTIEPPNSPPKVITLNLALSSSSALLATDGQRTPSTSGASSPRHFRIPSRPHTPLLDPRASPLIRPTQPPEPPPPRRSGELQRDPRLKIVMGPPPPINRAEKPKIPTKHSNLGHDSNTPSAKPAAALKLRDGRVSPFSNPSSSSSSPESELLEDKVAHTRFNGREIIPGSQKVAEPFDGPPVHYSLTPRRREDLNGGRGISPQITGDLPEQRPILPTRPSVIGSSPRTSSDVSRPLKGLVGPTDTVKTSKIGPSMPRTGDTTSISTAPKRIFSTPTSQHQTPPRTHGRSMTLDQTSDRTPAEFRKTAKLSLGQGNDAELRNAGLPSTGSSSNISSTSNEFPDFSLSNRRPPILKNSPREIPTKYDTRLFDVCGEYVCTTGTFTRVWSLTDGEQIMGLAHGEAIRITSLAFKPAGTPDGEGMRLWLGNNVGELLELDIETKSILATKTNAHSRREVIKIYRHRTDMWTLDDSGTLHVWAPDETGPPSLSNPSNPYQSFRVPKGHTFSITLKDELWYATGKDIRVFVPTLDGRVQFQVLQRPLSQAGLGEVTAGATIASQSDRVYFGHNDGKVSIYSRISYACLGTVNVSIYKINSLAGVGQYLWAAYNTGMIYVYDTTQVPWTVKKDWRAHENPVVNVIADRSSFWMMNRLQVISLGADNLIRLWDGMLQEDWLEAEMQALDKRFCSFELIKVLVMTWNAGASTPHSLRYNNEDAAFFPGLLQGSDSPDILVIGFQELVDLEDKKATAKSFFKSKKKDSSEQEHMSHQYRDWRDYLIGCLDDHMLGTELYHLLHSANLVGLFTCIFVRSSLRDRVSSLCATEIKRGMGGLHGNKGALIIRFRLDDTSLCLVNCHLAAGQTQTKDRNYDISAILDSAILPQEKDPSVRLDSYIGGGDGSMILDHEICILNGDLNYRIDTMSRDAVVNAVKTGNLSKLLERDQLLASKRKNASFRLRAFQEMPITFAPTYKYDVGTDNYDSSEKKRAPAWCDRILFRGREHHQRVQQLNYRRHEVRVSDHRPVTALFQLAIKRVSIKERTVVWEDCTRRLEEVRQNFAVTAKLDFLTNICGLDTASSGIYLSQQKKDTL